MPQGKIIRKWKKILKIGKLQILFMVTVSYRLMILNFPEVLPVPVPQGL